MPNDPDRTRSAPGAGRMHTAAIRARAGAFELDARVAISTRGLLAIGALVSGILLSTAAIVTAATRDRAGPRRLR